MPTLPKKLYKIKAKVWLYPGMGAWHFISVPEKQTKQIQETFGGMRRGFGSLRVIAGIGKTRWKTSIFPDNKTGSYVLPIKSEVRKKEKIKVDDIVDLAIEIQL